MSEVGTEEKKEIVRIRDAFREMKRPNIFDGNAYCVQIDEAFNSIKSRRNLETVVAEKMSAIFSRSTGNTRMKDFYDIYIL